ncbi:hypothetical protein EJ02DRAFT_410866 [Clathrospora elynae]|uniref:Tc1-like transposase DDE domain-containing protein n=1 Tax=Clathrospora elynae TaxID=706981 RepID=A0A6A5SBF7_9PLEO|nr:hypothetical protein EJ02DRAFT_439655 [Clathrospora elynae]KAF1938169.1 hypothetical protein EJ02DRAFT_410866 [Clathrospora elynae]
MFKASKQKKITASQAAGRIAYSNDHKDKPVQGFWDGVQFTDEAHLDPGDLPDERILRPEGERNNPENVVDKQPFQGNAVHFAAWVNYYEKQRFLTFYNDEYDDVVPVKPLPKPRRRPTTETDNEYTKRVAQWEAEKARQPKIEKPGNSMRAVYYVEKILPSYAHDYNCLIARSNELRPQVPRKYRFYWYIVEDNDPSHGTYNKESLPAIYRAEHGIRRLKHPSNSPDLNPIEGIWNIIKMRVKQRLYELNTIQDMKEALQEEWEKVTQDNIQKRINELPDRLYQV